MTRIAIATIDTEDGRMTIYYNGAHEHMTAVDGDYVEPLNAVAAPLSLDMAVDMIGKMYIDPVWDLQWIEREPEPVANKCWNCWAARTDVCECFPESCNQYDPIFVEEDDNDK